MNSKQAKRLRRHTNKALRVALDNPAITVRDREYERFLVPSQRYNVTVTESGEKTVKKDTAIHIRLKQGCAREVYKRVKRRVRANRKDAGVRFLQQLRDIERSRRAAAAAGGVEHA